MLEALYERGIAPDIVVGSSAGALNAAFVAANPPGVDSARRLQQVWRSTTRSDVFPFSPIPLLRALLRRSDHLFSNRGVARMVTSELSGVTRLEATRVKLGIVVTDLLDGDEKLLQSGPALVASSAIPGVFPPVTIDGRPYVDGGVADNTPISQALALGADTIYVLPTGVSARLDRPPPTALAMSVHAFNLLLHARLRQEIRTLRDRATLIVLPPPWPLNVLPTDFSRADELIQAGRDDAREALADEQPAGGPTDRAIARMESPTAAG
jgi:NTE family protein